MSVCSLEDLRRCLIARGMPARLAGQVREEDLPAGQRAGYAFQFSVLALALLSSILILTVYAHARDGLVWEPMTEFVAFQRPPGLAMIVGLLILLMVFLVSLVGLAFWCLPHRTRRSVYIADAAVDCAAPRGFKQRLSTSLYRRLQSRVPETDDFDWFISKAGRKFVALGSRIGAVGMFIIAPLEVTILHWTNVVSRDGVVSGPWLPWQAASARHWSDLSGIEMGCTRDLSLVHRLVFSDGYAVRLNEFEWTDQRPTIGLRSVHAVLLDAGKPVRNWDWVSDKSDTVECNDKWERALGGPLWTRTRNAVG